MITFHVNPIFRLTSPHPQNPRPESTPDAGPSEVYPGIVRVKLAGHAAAVFDDRAKLLAFAEDTGRHSALDKAVGKCLLGGIPTSGLGVMLSGRVSVEMVGKCGRGVRVDHRDLRPDVTRRRRGRGLWDHAVRVRLRCPGDDPYPPGTGRVTGRR